MLVKADIRSDYLLNPLYSELSLFLSLYDGLVEPSPTGWTLKAYAGVPGVLVKGSPFAGKTPAKTRSFDTATEALHSLKLGVDVAKGVILDVSKGLFLPGRTIHRSRLGVTADHVPQLYGSYPLPGMPGRVCVALSGDYDFARRTFFGMVEFAEVGTLWSE